MPILNDNKIVEIPTISKDRKLNRAVNSIKNMSAETFNKNVNTQRNGIDILWNNPDLTPQEIIDELGDDAVKLFQFHAALTTFILSVAQIEGIEVDVKLPTNAFEISEVGKITVTDGPYVP